MFPGVITTPQKREFPDTYPTTFEAIVIPIDYITPCSFEIQTSQKGDVFIDWGDGAFIRYDGGIITNTPTGVIKLKNGFSRDIKNIKFISDTFRNIYINKNTSITSFNTICNQNSKLETFTAQDIDIVTDFTGAFMGCIKLISVLLSRTGSGNKFANMFNGCSTLECINSIDTLNQTQTSSMFFNTPALVNPTPAEQTQIESGFYYTNQNNCPDYETNLLVKPINYTDTFIIDIDSDSLIDWGDGNYISYTSGQVSEIPTNNINILTNATWLSFLTDTVEEIDFHNASSINSFYQSMMSLTKLKKFTIQRGLNAYDLTNAFTDCSSLTHLTVFNSIFGNYFNEMFNGCINLECLVGITTSKYLSTTNMFLNTPSLVNPTLAQQSSIMNGNDFKNIQPCPIPPKVISTIPINYTEVEITYKDFSFTYNEPVIKGTGNVVLSKNGQVIETIPSSSLSLSGNTFSFSITTDLMYSSDYILEIETGVAISVDDGILSQSYSSWYFSTEEAVTIVITNNTLTDLSVTCDTPFRVFDGNNWNVYIANDEPVIPIYNLEVLVTSEIVPHFKLLGGDVDKVDIQGVPITSLRESFLGISTLTSFTIEDSSTLTDINSAWLGCSGLTSFPAIDTSNVTSISEAWRECTGLTSFPAIDTSKITDFYLTWYNCSSLTEFPVIDTSQGTSLYGAWGGCTGLTSFPVIDTSQGLDFSSAWYNCSSLTSFPLLNTSQGTSFHGAWKNCTGLTSFPNIDTSQGTIFWSAWQYCTGLTSFPLLITNKVTNFYYAWYGCSSLTSFPLLDTSQGTDFSAAWYMCSGLLEFPVIDTSQGTTFNSAWNGCNSLTSFPSIDTSAVTDFSSAWYMCSGLTEFPVIDTSAVTNFSSAWYMCSGLTEFPSIDTSAVTDFSSAWSGCSELLVMPLIDTSQGTTFEETWMDCVKLDCLNEVNTLNQLNTTNMFLNTSALVNPTVSEQTQIESGYNYINSNPCYVYDAPTWNIIPDQDALEYDMMTIDMSIYVISDGPIISYSLNNAPTWMSIDIDGIIFGMPEEQTTDFNITINATNKYGTGSATFNVSTIKNPGKINIVLTPIATASVVNIEIIGDANINGIEFTTGTHTHSASEDIVIINDGSQLNKLTNFKILDDVIKEVNIIDGLQLTSFDDTCFSLINLTDFNMDRGYYITSYYRAWRDCSNLTSFPLIDTSNATNFNGAWVSCSKLTSFPLIDTSNATNLSGAWLGCTGLTSFPAIDTSQGTNFDSAWSNCSGLTSFPAIDTSQGTNFDSAWSNCSSLTSFPVIDTSQGTNFSSAWHNCINLGCLTKVNTLNQTNTINMFYNTPRLTQPSPSDIGNIERGYDWTNANPCPAIPVFNGTIDDIIIYDNDTLRVDISDRFYGPGVAQSYVLNNAPTWMSIDDYGIITGTLNDLGVFDNITVTASNSVGDAVSNAFQIDVWEYTGPAEILITRADLYSNDFDITITGTAFVSSPNWGPVEITDSTWNVPRGDELEITVYNLGDGFRGLKHFMLDDYRIITDVNITDGTSLISLNSSFKGLDKMTNFTSNNLDNVTDLSYAFYGCLILSNIELLTTSKVSDLSYAFYNCRELTSFNIGDTSNVTNFYYAWYDCRWLTSFPAIDTSQGTNFDSAWSGCFSLTSFPLLDTTQGTDFGSAWSGCSGLTSFPNINTSQGTDFNGAWSNCVGLTSFPNIDTTQGTNFNSAWSNCSSLPSFPAIDTSKGTNFGSAWWNCSSLTSFPVIDTSQGTNFGSAWDNCFGLTSFPVIDTSQGTDFSYAWKDCVNLVCLTNVDTTKQTATTDMFFNTPALTTPNATDQTAILAGMNWTNPDPCPLDKPLFIGNIDNIQIFELTALLLDVSPNFTGAGTVETYSLQNAPTWMSINNSGLITGTSETAQTYTNVTVTGTNVLGNDVSNSFQIDVKENIEYKPADIEILRSGTNTSVDIEITGIALIDGIEYTTGTHTIPMTAAPIKIVNDGFMAGELTYFRIYGTVIESLNIIDGSSLTSLYRTCYGLISPFKTFNATNIHNVTDVTEAWGHCSGLTSFPLINIPLATDFSYAWVSCSRLTSFPVIDTSAVTNFSNAWQGCSGLTSFPVIDTSNVTIFENTWMTCTSLTSFPYIDTGKGTNCNNAWNNCTSLICLTAVNTLAAGLNTGTMFPPSLEVPNASDQAAIEAGMNWTNPGSCP